MAQRQYMMRRLFALTLALSLCLPFAAAAENAGVNRTIDVEGTPIDSITVFPETSSDSENFSIHIALSGESAENVTNVEWTVQQCINSGVCNPPEVIPMTAVNVSTGVNWTSTITPVETHAYINYDIILTYANGEDETFPEDGFVEGGKVWSDCWVSGADSGGNNCPETVVLPAEPVPAPALLATIVVGLSAALLAKRED